MNQTHFHNTIELQGEELLVRDGKCRFQEQVILKFFQDNPDFEYTPFQVMEALRLYNTPIQSIRRAMTNLSSPFDKHKKPVIPKLIKTQNRRKGIYGTDNFTWKLRIEKGQRQLF